ncbi:helix-turn-helix domain-containing protein [Kribbella sancticallisti]|uniref:Helix-turn-helix domain-containing protein n=1 Tax=Kribbella sancticallisti TaxID=460087 RepID=A0ABP4PM24_9ACTN
MDKSVDARVQAVAALDEPTRRRLYDHVVAQPTPVSRDDAAEALGVPRTTAAFHLDKLADEGLLEVVFERRTGRSGPGAGRPAKLYRRSDREIEVSFPERQYDVAGRLLAAALEDAESTGDSPRQALERRAGKYGEAVGRAARSEPRTPLTRVLESHGFEPREHDLGIDLINCPFHALAKDYTDLVCTMNLRLVGGVLTGLGDTGLLAELDPQPPHCCVRLTRIGSEGGEG